MVTDTTGHHLVNREGLEKTGKFAFTTDKCVTCYTTCVSRVTDDEYYFRYDVFEICFISAVPSNMRGSRHEVGADC